MLIQIIENEELQDKADFDNSEVWLLSRDNPDIELDDRLIVVSELVETSLPSSYKLPQLMTEIYNRHDNFTYEVITRNKDNFAVKGYVCDENCIKVILPDTDNAVVEPSPKDE